MKKAPLLTGLFLFSATLPAQTIVCGRITNAKENVVKLNYWDGEQHSIEAKLTQEGSFKINHTVKEPGKYDLEHGGETTPMFLYPDDSLYVTLDTKQFDETVTYSGRGAEANNYIAKQYLYFETSIGSPEFRQRYYRKIAFSDAQTFSVYADSLTQVKLNYLNQFKQTLPVAFYDYQYANIVFDYATDKADYPKMHYYVRGIKDSTVKVSPEFYAFYDQLKINNENYLPSYDFVSYLGYYVRHKTKQKLGRDSISYADQTVSAGSLLKGKIKERAIHQIIVQAMEYGTPAEVKEMYGLSAKEISDPDLKQTIETKYTLISSLLPGNPAPPISLKTKEGKLVNLSDFKGKVVYLDFWASWCQPCMMEMPSAKKLQDTFATRDVVFLYVSVDENEKAWMKTMEAKGMKGVHLHTQGFDGDVPKKYGVNGIPSYYLIGRDGKIISNNPSRPSDAAVYREIENALKVN
jgi:thiol-disulfide isomerase/thioredoxin